MAENRISAGPRGELITIQNDQGLQLDGILFSATGSDCTVVHVHGSCGNFYSHKFIRVFAAIALRNNVNVVSINMSGHDSLAEGYFDDGRFPYVGGAVVDFEMCVSDICAAVGFCRNLTSRVVLQGHSLGCDRVLHYLRSTGEIEECVLLAPCDSYQLQSLWIAPELVEEQIARLEVHRNVGEPLEWLPSKEYGVRQGEGWTYAIPITRRALLSIMKGPPFEMLRLSDPAEFRLPVAALVHIGGADALQTWPAAEMFDYLRARLAKLNELWIPQADHMIGGCEEIVADHIVRWIRRH